jgi:hypothetical protein
MPTSSMDHLLDRVAWRCTKCEQPVRAGCHCWDRVTPEEKLRAAATVRLHVREYAQSMYPEVWQAMSPSARTSIFNCIYNAVYAALGDLNPRVEHWPGD